MIKDSGQRKEFETGAVRDMQEGKGRCDLLPLDVVAVILNDLVIYTISLYQREGNIENLYDAIYEAIGIVDDNSEGNKIGTIEKNKDKLAEVMLDVSIHFEEGATKYGEMNWTRGLPTKSYINSAIRHYLKHLAGLKDENHFRAFIWNILCCIWTHRHKPEMIDLPFKEGVI